MNWEQKRFSQIMQISKGEAITRATENEGQYPVILGGQEPAYYIDRYNHDGKAVVVSRSGASAGYVSIWDEPIFITDGFLIEPLSEEYDYRFIYYLLKYYGKALRDLQNGSAIPHVTPKTIYGLKAPIPSLPEQKRIVSIISTYDNLIEVNNKRIKVLEQMAENLYKEWFVRFRFPGHESAEFDNGIPKGWEKVGLGSVLSKMATGLNPRKNFVLGNGENYYVTIKNMGENNIYLDDRCDRIDDEAIVKINNRSDLREGDLLFSGIGTIGRVYLISIPTDNWNISESVFTMRPNQRINSEYLYMLLLSDDIQNYCQANANGAAQKGIRMADLIKYSFWLAPKQVMNSFSEVVRPIIKQVDSIRKVSSNLFQQRDLLLPRLMSARLEV